MKPFCSWYCGGCHLRGAENVCLSPLADLGESAGLALEEHVGEVNCGGVLNRTEKVPQVLRQLHQCRRVGYSRGRRRRHRRRAPCHPNGSPTRASPAASVRWWRAGAGRDRRGALHLRLGLRLPPRLPASLPGAHRRGRHPGARHHRHRERRVTADVARQLGDATVVLRGGLARTSLRLSVIDGLSVLERYAWIDTALHGWVRRPSPCRTTPRRRPSRCRDRAGEQSVRPSGLRSDGVADRRS